MEAPYEWTFEVQWGLDGGEMMAQEGAAAVEAERVRADVEVVAAKAPAAEEPALDEPETQGGEIEDLPVVWLHMQVRKYYYFGGQRVAMRQIDYPGANEVLYYLVGDHLGTTSLVLCGNVDGCDGVAGGSTLPNGGKVAESRHYPYGEVRWTWPEGESTFPTDYRFTGQRDVGLGLTHMGARFYDSSLGRWLSADTIVPDPNNPQALNRYTYVYNNTLRHVDPSGHCAPDDEECNALADLIERETDWHVFINRCQNGGNVVGCKFWTGQELALLWETFQEHIFREEYEGQYIVFVRMEGDEYAGLHTGSWADETKYSQIELYDTAWTTTPSMGIQWLWQGALGEEEAWFQGTAAHELTHSAVWFDPELLDRFRDLYYQDRTPQPNLFLGLFYDWSKLEKRFGAGTDEYYKRVAAEMLAMMVSGVMYDPWFD